MLYCILIFIHFSCDEHSSTSNKEPKDSLVFDSKSYQLANYVKRMNTFMNKNSQKVDKSTDYIVALNASQCPTCVRTQFSNYIKRFSDLSGNFLVVSDDSSFVDATNDPSVRFEIFPRDLFERFNVVHRNTYIYSLKNEKIHSSELLTEDIIDSLTHK
ncbi:MAG: hypothetical protein ACQERC_04415 [Bacteroidota bacterium]